RIVDDIGDGVSLLTAASRAADDSYWEGPGRSFVFQGKSRTAGGQPLAAAGGARNPFGPVSSTGLARKEIAATCDCSLSAWVAPWGAHSATPSRGPWPSGWGRGSRMALSP